MQPRRAARDGAGAHRRAGDHRAVRLDDLPLLPQLPGRDLSAAQEASTSTPARCATSCARSFRSASSRGLPPSRCAARRPTSISLLYDKLMAQQAAWVSQEVRPDPIFKVAAQVGMTRAQFDSCRENRAMIAQLNGIKDRGRTLGHHRHAELLHPGQAGEVGDRHAGDPRDGGPDPGGPGGRIRGDRSSPLGPGGCRVGAGAALGKPSQIAAGPLRTSFRGCLPSCISTGCGCWASSRSWSRPSSWSSRA